MKRVFGLCAAAAVAMSVLGAGTARADQVEALLQKLIDKGVLTAEEAREIRIQGRQEAASDIPQAKEPALPAWLQAMKIKGDFRLRYQLDRAKTVNDARSDRHRGRIRLRLGMDAKINEKLTVGAGVATGTSDVGAANKDRARSTNQSFDNAFSKHPVNLDYAYAKYAAADWLSLTGGKILLKDALWEPGDLMWDTDITPEGAALEIARKTNAGTKMWIKSGAYILDESHPSNDDPYMVHLQPGVEIAVSENISLKGAIAADYFAVKASAIDNSANSNTGSSGNVARPTGNFFNVLPAVELAVNEPFKSLGIGALNVPCIRLFGEYVENLAGMEPDRKKSGFMVGFGFGAEKIAAWGDWQFGYNYAKLGRDAVLDVLPDSDRYDGQTNMRAHEVTCQYGLGKNTWLSFDAYRAERLQKPRAPTTVVQADWNMKF